jgi:hypothetical protein
MYVLIICKVFEYKVYIIFSTFRKSGAKLFIPLIPLLEKVEQNYLSIHPKNAGGFATLFLKVY